MAKEAEVSGATKRKFAGDDDGEQAEALVAPPPPPPNAVTQSEEAPSTSSFPNPNVPEEDAFLSTMDDFCWDEDYQQQRAFGTEDLVKVPYVGDKEPLSALAAEYQTGSPILQEKIKLLGEQYCALRRTRGDGNCFYRSFMFSYLEHLLETQDKSEVDRVLVNIEQCKMTLQNLGYAEFTFEDFFNIFIEQLNSVLGGSEPAISHEELVDRSRAQYVSDYVVMFFRFVTAGEMRRRAEFFEPFVAGLTNSTVEQFCKASVEPMGEESDHVHIIALCDALGVPIRVVYLDRSSCDTNAMTVNHHDFVPASDLTECATNNSVSEMKEQPKPYVTLLYRPGHYDILYPK